MQDINQSVAAVEAAPAAETITTELITTKMATIIKDQTRKSFLINGIRNIILTNSIVAQYAQQEGSSYLNDRGPAYVLLI